MLKLLEAFVAYAKGTPTGRMIIHFILFMMLVSWVGIITMITMNFKTLAEIYDRYQTNPNIRIEEALVVSNQVNVLIAEQRLRLGVDRLYVSKFHNGKVDVNGVHFIYFSRISESNGPGVSDEMKNTQNLPLSIFPNMLTSLSDGECYAIEGVDQTVENASFLSSMGVSSMMVCPIYDNNQRLIGIIGAEGVTQPINTIDTPHMAKSLTTLASVLGTLLSVQ